LDPGSRISDPGSKNSNKREREKKFVVIPFFCSHKIHKTENYFVFELLKKKSGPMMNFLCKILSLSSQKYSFGIQDPRSGIQKKPIPDPGSGSRGKKCTGSWIRIRNTVFTSSK
jgi:hypothetical protein